MILREKPREKELNKGRETQATQRQNVWTHTLIFNFV